LVYFQLNYVDLFGLDGINDSILYLIRAETAVDNVATLPPIIFRLESRRRLGKNLGYSFTRLGRNTGESKYSGNFVTINFGFGL
jgi:hypothetical protein